MDSNRGKKPISPQKLAANRANGKRSHGPKTEAGKATASQNAYKHGVFALRLFPTDKVRAEDGADYEALYAALCAHYEPQGVMENLWLEKAATEALRNARILGYHQKTTMHWLSPYESQGADRLLRYEIATSRGFANAIKQLEELQARRASESQQDAPEDGEEMSENAAQEPAPDEPNAPAELATPEAPTSADSTNDAPNVCAAGDKAAVAPQEPKLTPANVEPTPEPHDLGYSGRPRWIENEEDRRIVNQFDIELYGIPLH